MPSGAVQPSQSAAEPDQLWVLPVAALVVAVVLARWVLLAFDRTDLFVDETQYWLWGQDFQWGYYSKPPLIAWLIGAVTTLAGSDAAFWIRMPSAALNGITAFLLAALSARTWGSRSAIWVAAAYLSLPLVALGMMLISTDSVMAPFFAGALLAWWRLAETRKARYALIAGALIGVAFLGKYAAIYFVVGAALAAIVFPRARIGWRNAALLGLAFLVVIAPNLIWNALNGLTTIAHTADNIGWIRGTANAAETPGLNGFLVFFGSQFAVMGPILFASLLVALVRFRTAGPLVALALVPLAAVSFQSVVDTTYANWAASAYFAGTPVAMAFLARVPWLRIVGLGINIALATFISLLTLWPNAEILGIDPPLERYTGRTATSSEIIALARANGNVPIYADNRDVLADLFYTGRDSGLTIYAPRPTNRRPAHHYEQEYPLPADLTGPILAVLNVAVDCPDLVPPVPVGREAGAYGHYGLEAHLLDAACLSSRQ
jgi:4-amino-4-deoxy-L-arabinose transferase-like glycosyltransferase